MVLGDIIDADVEAFVNTVNTVGVMGKGVALQFKRAFPENFRLYKAACDAGKLQPGQMLLWRNPSLRNPRFILNVATKGHWRANSRLEHVEAGVKAIREMIVKHGIKSIAIPPLGCGNGGLEWSQVKPIIVRGLSGLEDVDIRVYTPRNEPPQEQRIATERPNLTPTRAYLVAAIDGYKEPGYRLGRMELQKIAYLLQRLGSPLAFRFEKQQFGPYSHGLLRAVDVLEGHYVRGLGDLSHESAVYALPEGVREAKSLLRDDPHAPAILAKLDRLIAGFDSSYGLELLSTVDWVIAHHEAKPGDLASVVQAVQRWNGRKGELFSDRHIQLALTHLQSVGLDEASSAAD